MRAWYANMECECGAPGMVVGVPSRRHSVDQILASACLKTILLCAPQVLAHRDPLFLNKPLLSSRRRPRAHTLRNSAIRRMITRSNAPTRANIKPVSPPPGPREVLMFHRGDLACLYCP